jgi:hypothetical protein
MSLTCLFLFLLFFFFTITHSSSCLRVRLPRHRIRLLRLTFDRHHQILSHQYSTEMIKFDCGAAVVVGACSTLYRHITTTKC